MSKKVPGNGKHLTLSDRSYIESSICKGKSFIDIAKYLCKDPSSIGKEVLKHRVYSGSHYKSKFNNYCAKRLDCNKTHICLKCSKYYYKDYRCANCMKCNTNCKDFVKEICKKITSGPYVCNGCEKQKKCHLDKYFYTALTAEKDYMTTLIETRQGINIDENKLKIIDATITPMIKNGHSPYQVLANNKDIPLYQRAYATYFLARDAEMRKDIRDSYNLYVKVIELFTKLQDERSDKADPQRIKDAMVALMDICENKTYKDFQDYIAKHPKEEVVEMDTVIGTASSKKVLLTMLFRSSRLMIAFLLDRLHYLNVVEVFDYIEYNLGAASMYDLMPTILTDRGFEFTHPHELEYGINGLKRTKIFYCDAMSPYQKGAIEKNHEYIRKFLPKGSSFDNLTQDNINLMLSHINSTKREILNNMSPIEVFLQKNDDFILELLDIKQIPPDKIILKNNLLK